MAATTAAQFARQLRHLGATITIRDGRDVIAQYGDGEVTARFARDPDAFDTAWRTGTSATGEDPIHSMAGVRRAVGLPQRPILTLGATGRRNSLTHILQQGWLVIAECGVSLRGEHTEGAPRDVNCRRCRSIWRQR
jgi:hypothetical protein